MKAVAATAADVLERERRVKICPGGFVSVGGGRTRAAAAGGEWEYKPCLSHSRHFARFSDSERAAFLSLFTSPVNLSPVRHRRASWLASSARVSAGGDDRMRIRSGSVRREWRGPTDVALDHAASEFLSSVMNSACPT